jgi:hypothetical protein
MYELQKLALADLKAEIINGYQGRNQQLGREVKGKVIEEPALVGGGSINHTKMDSAIEKLTGPEVAELEKDIKKIEDVYRNLTPQQQQFFDFHYTKHLNVVECANKMSYCRQSGQGLKRQIIEKTAVRLGYIR